MAWKCFTLLVLILVTFPVYGDDLPRVKDCEEPIYSLDQYDSNRELMLELDVRAYKECLFHVAFTHQIADIGEQSENQLAIAALKESEEALQRVFVSYNSALQQRLSYWRAEVKNYFSDFRTESELRTWLEERSAAHVIPAKFAGFCVLLETVGDGADEEPTSVYFTGGFKGDVVIWNSVDLGPESMCTGTRPAPNAMK